LTSDRTALPDYLEIGRIIRPHGIRGEMVVQAGSDLLLSLTSGTEILVGQDRHPLVLERIRPHRGRLLLKVGSINDRDQAETLRSQNLYLSSDQVEPLPDGEYYYWQILGLEVYEESGDRLGVVKNIIETGANDVYVIENDEGNEILVPAIEEVIRDVDLDSERMTVRLLPGLE
jgi:16S rRNA processing protein RimM